MPATFTQRFQVRFDECAPDGTARASALLRFVVETAFGHSAGEGFPLAWYDTRGLYWLVRRADLDLRRPVSYGESLDITTEVIGFRRIWARRRNTIRNVAEETLASLTMDWVFTDRGGNPTRIVPEMEAAFPGLDERLEITHLRVGDPPAGLRPGEYVVPSHEADPRGHMNNAAYIDLLEDSLSARGVSPQDRPAACAFEYVRPVVPGDVLRQWIWEESDRWVMVGTTAENQPVVRAWWRRS